MNARVRYEGLRGIRDNFMRPALEASRLTIPYLIKDDDDTSQHKNLRTPWQSVGAKGVVTLASKLMLALLPVNTSFFKLQIDDSTLIKEDIDPQIKAELDVSFSRIERYILNSIAASDDRVVIHQALKHLVVSGNSLIFMDKENLKVFPLNRYVCDRDGMGNVIEIVTKEAISKAIIDEQYPGLLPRPNNVQDNDTDRDSTEVNIYTHVVREANKFVWYQEVMGIVLPKSRSSAPLETSPWIPLRFNVCDGEAYGRGRVEEFLGDLKSLEALSQALVEGSSAAAKVVFTVSPSSTTKPATLAAAGNGAIIQGRPDDIGVVQVGKTADFRTAYEMAQTLERRLSEAFLILTVRQSERTTAEEVRMTQQELEEQLGGLFSMLTVEFLVPYINRKLSVFQKSGKIPKLPKGMVNPTIVAGVNALGRGQDVIALNNFMQTIAQNLGPEAVMKFVNPEELIKRLAAAQGIDMLGLVKSQEDLQQEQQQAQKAQAQMELTKQAGQFAQTREKAMEFNANTQQAQAPNPPSQAPG
jgi:hypothetical protein